MGRKDRTQNNDQKKLENFQFTIQGGMLEALGINMYSTLGKCLVEFIANAYDAEATKVELTIPFDKIEKNRQEVRAEAKKLIEQGDMEKTSIITLPLDSSIEVTIRDDGHGMSPQDVSDKFLPINRHRRRNESTNKEDHIMSEHNKRRVMGRKGLGKLAGFGASEIICIRSKKAGNNFSTKFELDYKELSQAKNLTTHQITPTYDTDSDISAHWTEIQLKNIKCDAVKYSENTLKDTIIDNFYGIDPTEFEIKLNGTTLTQTPPDYDFYYPEGKTTENLEQGSVLVEDFGKIDFEYVVMFRKNKENLRAANRGARIYCNKRLAAGPSLFGMPTGMHGFHYISYMECVVKADKLDELGIDLINTNRTELKQDNEVVSTFINKIETLMVNAISAFSKHRENTALVQVEKNPIGKNILATINTFSKKHQAPARSFIKKLAATTGVGSKEFQELTPLFLSSLNAGEVIMKLIDIKADPKSIHEIIISFNELLELEKNDALKLYKARKNGIDALDKLIGKGLEIWQKKGIENDLHELLKNNTWLINPEYNNYITSDNDLANVYSRLSKELKIDNHADPKDAANANKRPDLVFLSGNASKSNVIIIELKSPTLPLEKNHLDQLELYMNRTEDWLISQGFQSPKVQGFLIGAKAKTQSKAEGVYMLEKAINNAGPNTMWRVISLEELLDNAKNIYTSEIEALKKALEDDD